jgi:hypothetical protein
LPILNQQRIIFLPDFLFLILATKGTDVKPESSITLYKTDDGQTALEVRIQTDTVWLSLKQIAELFKRDNSVISRHLRNIFKEKELHRDSVVAFFATTAKDGKTYQVEYFNLDAIISVGYRVNSKRGTQFRCSGDFSRRSAIIIFVISYRGFNRLSKRVFYPYAPYDLTVGQVFTQYCSASSGFSRDHDKRIPEGNPIQNRAVYCFGNKLCRDEHGLKVLKMADNLFGRQRIKPDLFCRYHVKLLKYLRGQDAAVRFTRLAENLPGPLPFFTIAIIEGVYENIGIKKYLFRHHTAPPATTFYPWKKPCFCP